MLRFFKGPLDHLINRWMILFSFLPDFKQQRRKSHIFSHDKVRQRLPFPHHALLPERFISVFFKKRLGGDRSMCFNKRNRSFSGFSFQTGQQRKSHPLTLMVCMDIQPVQITVLCQICKTNDFFRLYSYNCKMAEKRVIPCCAVTVCRRPCLHLLGGII